MDIEQLKLIIDLIQGLSEDAFTGFVFYILTTDTLPFILQMSFWSLVVTLVYKGVSKVIKIAQDEAISGSKYEELIKIVNNYADFKYGFEKEDAYKKAKLVLQTHNQALQKGKS